MSNIDEAVVPPENELLSRKEAAAYLGLSRQTLAGWACNKRYTLPFVKIGRLVKYRKADLEAFVTQQMMIKEAA